VLYFTYMPYITVEEMRKNPEIFRGMDSGSSKTGTTHARFEGSTVPEMAFAYFKKEEALLECGPIRGTFTKVMQEKGYSDLHALDFIDVLDYPDRKRVTMHEIDFNKDRFPYKDRFFGSVVAWGIVEHLENPFHFIREIHRVMKPGATFIFSVPNVFHITSRLLFLKRGMFPRWNKSNNHIFVLPRGVFEKTVLKYFNLVEERFVKPKLELPLLRRLTRFLPANQWFGDYVVYVLKKKEDIS